MDKSSPLLDGIPAICDTVLERIQKYVSFKPDQMTVNEYKPGQGLYVFMMQQNTPALPPPTTRLGFGKNLVQMYINSPTPVSNLYLILTSLVAVLDCT